MVIAHDQDDVVPVELAHQVKPHVRLVRVGGHRPQEGQMDTLGGRRTFCHGLHVKSNPRGEQMSLMQHYHVGKCPKRSEQHECHDEKTLEVEFNHTR